MRNIRTVAFNVLSIVFLIVIGYLVIFGKSMSDGRGWVLFASSALCALFGNLDKIENLKLSRDGFEAKMREADRVVDEAKSALTELHKFAEMAGAMLINMLSGEGRLGGQSPKEIDEGRTRILELLKSIDLDDKKIKKVSLADKKWVANDYSKGIIKMLEKSTVCSPEQHQVVTTMYDLWNSKDHCPTPHDFFEKLKQHGITDSEVLELVKDYKYYMENGEHRRPNVWQDRKTWLFSGK